MTSDIPKPKKFFKRRRTPTVIQMEMVECGAAALGIILGYFKKFISLEKLRVLCGITRDGSNAWGLVEAAKRLGLEAEALKKNIPEIYDLKPPFIVFWGFDHFLVIEGFGRKKVYLNDPAIGPRTISYEEFSENFTGFALKFTPLDSFQKGGRPPSLLSMLKNRLKNVTSGFVYLVISSLVMAVPSLAIPYFARYFLDFIIVEKREPVSYFLLFTGIIVGYFCLGYLQKMVTLLLNIKLAVQLSGKFLWHFLRLPTSFFSERYAGDLAYRQQLNNQIVRDVTAHLAVACINVLLTIIYAIAIGFQDWRIATVVITLGTINLCALPIINRSRVDAYAKFNQDFAKAIGFSIGGISTIDSIKSMAGENDFFSRWWGYFSKVLEGRQNIEKKEIILTFLPNFTHMLGLVSILVFGGDQVLRGTLSTGSLLSLFLLLGLFFRPIDQLLSLGEVIQNMKSDLLRLNDVQDFQEDPFITHQKEKDETKKLSGEISCENLSFGFDPSSPPLIENFSLSIEPGKKIALVGKTGSGKSTLLRLLCGIHIPWKGMIKFDGMDHTQIDRYLYTSSIATVDQTITLFEGTLMDNLVLWNRSIAQEDCDQALKDACIYRDIIDKPGGYRMPLLEGGRNLSGGQQQRIEIARAFVKKPTILILDEATSELDAEMESKIMEAIIARGCTCIMVAHRLSTISKFDEILVMDRGKIIDRGTHEELKKKSGIYQNLVNIEKG